MLHRFAVTHNRFDDFCLFAGWGIRVGYPSTQAAARVCPPSSAATSQGKIVLALTANPFYNLKGVTPGDSLVRRQA